MAAGRSGSAVVSVELGAVVIVGAAVAVKAVMVAGCVMAALARSHGFGGETISDDLSLRSPSNRNRNLTRFATAVWQSGVQCKVSVYRNDIYRGTGFCDCSLSSRMQSRLGTEAR